MNWQAERADYEKEVRGIEALAQSLSKQGLAKWEVAEHVVKFRNQLKADFRRAMAPETLALVEARNRAKYGDPLGPTAKQLLAKYESWDAVIAAASRHASLNDLL